MRVRTIILTVFCTLLVSSAVFADPQPVFGDHNVIYLGEGKVFRAAQPRQLTLRARVQQFEFNPTGEKIAYTSIIHDHGARYYRVSYVDTWRSEPVEVVLIKGDATESAPPPNNDDSDIKDLVLIDGWSADGRYLLIAEYKQFSADISQSSGREGQAANGYFETTLRLADVSKSPASLKTIGVFRTGRQSSDDQTVTFVDSAWSLDRTRILVAPESSFNGASANLIIGNDNPPLPAIYNVVNGQTKKINVTSSMALYGWADDMHLSGSMAINQSGKRSFFDYDLKTDLTKETFPTRAWYQTIKSHLGYYYAAPQVVVTTHHPALVLETIPHRLEYAPKTAAVDANTVWVNDNMSKKDLNLLAVAITPGKDDPKATWSPQGDAVAYIAHGDIFMTDLVRDDANPREKLAVGESLNCDELTEIADANLKMIGFGFVEYTQDHDERFPKSSDNTKDLLAPYLQDPTLFAAGDSPFIYLGTGQQLGLIESPSDQVLGTMDTPCSHNVLYCDGHVKSFPK
jgi:prepilin-type processing-associated H-X9-DG protein